MQTEGRFIIVSGVLPLTLVYAAAAAAAAAAGAAPQQFEIFDPTATRLWVTNGADAAAVWHYNHCASIWKWRGVLFSVWNANHEVG